MLLLRYTLLLLGVAPAPWNVSQTEHDTRIVGAALPGASDADRFRHNMLTPEESAQVEDLLRKIGHDDFRVREQATLELRYWRPGAEVLIRRHIEEGPLEKRRRLQLVLQRGLGRWPAPKAEAAVRLAKKSPEMLGVLLEYLPFAEDTGVEREIASVLRSFGADDRAAAATLHRHTFPAALERWIFDPNEIDPSPTVQADWLARRFFETVADGNITMLAEMTQLPFSLGNGVVLTSPDQRDDFFRQATKNWRDSRPASLTFQHVARGDDFARLASGEEGRLVRAIPGHELRAVHVRLRRGADPEESGAVLVRVSDRGARVVGLGYLTPRLPGTK